MKMAECPSEVQQIMIAEIEGDCNVVPPAAKINEKIKIEVKK